MPKRHLLGETHSEPLHLQLVAKPQKGGDGPSTRRGGGREQLARRGVHLGDGESLALSPGLTRPCHVAGWPGWRRQQVTETWAPLIRFLCRTRPLSPPGTDPPGLRPAVWEGMGGWARSSPRRTVPSVGWIRGAGHSGPDSTHRPSAASRLRDLAAASAHVAGIPDRLASVDACRVGPAVSSQPNLISALGALSLGWGVFPAASAAGTKGSLCTGSHVFSALPELAASSAPSCCPCSKGQNSPTGVAQGLTVDL